MAVTLRLAKFGHKKKLHYRIVAAEKTKKRDGRFIEILGTYNPRTNPPSVTLKEDKVQKWMATGAQLTIKVRDIIKRRIPGLVEGREKHQLSKIQAARKARKERAAARSGQTAKSSKTPAKKPATKKS